LTTINEAFKDPAWGTFVWLAMTAGARRGELCALRWDLLDLENAVVSIRTSIAQLDAVTWEKDTKKPPATADRPRPGHHDGAARVSRTL